MRIRISSGSFDLWLRFKVDRSLLLWFNKAFSYIATSSILCLTRQAQNASNISNAQFVLCKVLLCTEVVSFARNVPSHRNFSMLDAH